MTNKEILQADTLDILFENRNKQYGAYALRRGYDQRMLQALAITGGALLLLLLLTAFTKGKKINEDEKPGPDVNVTTVLLPPRPQEPPRPETPAPPKQRKEKKIAYVTIRVEEDYKANSNPPAQSELENGNIGLKNEDGPETGDIFKAAETSSGGTGAAPEKEVKPKEPDFIPRSKEAGFPGGNKAFSEFLSRYLQTPGDLEPGEKKVVLLRFKVGVDGRLTDIQVIQSDGDEFTKEVMRVLKKMPAWEPAEQNGIKVPVYFTQPVTFIGREE